MLRTYPTDVRSTKKKNEGKHAQKNKQNARTRILHEISLHMPAHSPSVEERRRRRKKKKKTEDLVHKFQNTSAPTIAVASAMAIADKPPFAKLTAELSTLALHQVATAAKPLHIGVH